MTTRRIKTYEDLLQEEQRLTVELKSYQLLLREDIAGIKSGLNPIKRITETAKNLFTRGDNGPLLNFGVNFGLDMILRRMILGRAGWIAKVVVPYFVKNYASHLINDEQRKAVGKSLSKVLSKFLMKKKKEPFEAAPPQ